jgi:heat shock protein HslJ
MEKKLFVFVLLIAFASTQQVPTNQLRVDQTSEGSNNQLQTNGNEKTYPVVTLDGEFTTSIKNDPDLRINLSGNQVSIINGCNTITGKILVQTNEFIKFGQFSGTNRA